MLRKSSFPQKLVVLLPVILFFTVALAMIVYFYAQETDDISLAPPQEITPVIDIGLETSDPAPFLDDEGEHEVISLILAHDDISQSLAEATISFRISSFEDAYNALSSFDSRSGLVLWLWSTIERRSAEIMSDSNLPITSELLGAREINPHLYEFRLNFWLPTSDVLVNTLHSDTFQVRCDAQNATCATISYFTQISEETQEDC